MNASPSPLILATKEEEAAILPRRSFFTNRTLGAYLALRKTPERHTCAAI